MLVYGIDLIPWCTFDSNIYECRTFKSLHCKIVSGDAALAWAFWGFWCKCYLENVPNVSEMHCFLGGKTH